jgi:hypothetical protein
VLSIGVSSLDDFNVDVASVRPQRLSTEHVERAHDAMDCSIPSAEIASKSGASVADLACQATEEHRLPSRPPSNRLYLEHLPDNPWNAQTIGRCDKVDAVEAVQCLT